MDRPLPAGLTPAAFSAAEGRRFALTMAAAFAVLGAVAWWRGGTLVPRTCWSLGAAFAAGAVLAPARLGPVQRTWMAFGHELSKVTTPLVMAVIYFAVLTPMAIVVRAAGHDPLRRRRHPRQGRRRADAAPGSGDADSTSGWHPHEPSQPLTRQF